MTIFNRRYKFLLEPYSSINFYKNTNLSPTITNRQLNVPIPNKPSGCLIDHSHCSQQLDSTQSDPSKTSLGLKPSIVPQLDYRGTRARFTKVAGDKAMLDYGYRGRRGRFVVVNVDEWTCCGLARRMPSRTDLQLALTPLRWHTGSRTITSDRTVY